MLPFLRIVVGRSQTRVRSDHHLPRIPVPYVGLEA